MLTELHIRDFAIIDELQLAFAPGFTVLTGETGAGKSIIIDAVELVLGGRADTTVVRAGADQAIVEAAFRLAPEHQAAVAPVLEREELQGDEDDLLLLGREVRLNGRNVCRINGRTVTLALLREVADGLVDIHGQSEHLSLLRVSQHVNLLDRYAELWPLRTQVAGKVAQVRAVRRELADLLRSEQELARRADLLQFQVGEIQAAALEPGEEETLAEERLRLTNAEQLAELAGEALQALEGGGEEASSALDMLGVALRALERLARVDPAQEPQSKAAENVYYQAQELVRGVHAYQDEIEYSPHRLQEVEDRLALIRRLERKYGAKIPDVLAHAERSARELEAITHSEERVEELRVEEGRLLAELSGLAVDLSIRRRDAAERLAAGIETELGDLRMEGARFGVGFEWREDEQGVPVTESLVSNLQSLFGESTNVRVDEWVGKRVAFDSTGIDHLEFLVSPNPGEPLKPMAKIASGGETSRLMLALKTVLSRADETPTLIFDEIDQGIGGRVGATVGEKLWQLAAGTGPGGLRHQVLCVTHLPQLAAFGDAHFHVEKHVEQTEEGERTVTRVLHLEGQAQVEELVQMLGAAGEAATRSAEEILAQVAARKA
ncbi:MAG: DNA repair protein RecN [Anaerolineae bacterium]|nr:DNA repair protein RecN [Anaerolineae bacterium]